jgi:hypothetical protein
MLNRLNTRQAPLAAQDEPAPEDEAIRAKRRAKAFADLAAHEKAVEKQRQAILEDIEKAQAFLRPFDEARTAIRRSQERLRELQYSMARPKADLESIIRDDAPAAVGHIVKKCNQLVRDMLSAAAIDIDDMEKRQKRVKSLHELRKDAEAFMDRPIDEATLADLEARAKEVIYT